jgi:hypothetical protein
MDALTNNAITRCLVLVVVMIKQNKLYQGLNNPHNMTPSLSTTIKKNFRENILKQTKRGVH